MRRATTSLTVACTLSLGLGLGAASCATAIGLDQVSRVDCVEDCGADAGIDVGEEGPASDGTLGDAPVVDSAMADRQMGEASPRTCTPGLACDGGRCDDAGVCRPGCTSNAGCAAPKPVCDTATNVCVPCLPQSDTCPQGTICVPQGSEYACATGCNTVADCTASDAGTPAANACCNHVCSNTTTDDQNCGGCGLVCPGGASAACAQSKCVYTIGGTLAGLAASESIVLQDNASDNLTLHADGPFSFSTPIATGSMYDVTILTTPAGQTCTLAGASGVVAGADVTSVQVSCMSCYVPGTMTFSYTGAVQSWTVPCGVTSASFTVDGAAGAANAQGNVAGGLGGSATGTLAVAQGQVLEIFVGGTGGWNGGGAAGTGASTCSGGGGGGASDVRVSPYALANRIIVAGGGGGAGGDRVDTVGAGAGGGGGGGYYGGGGGESWGGAGGGAGTQAAGGAAGCGSGCSGFSTCGGVGSAGSGGAGGAAAASDQAGAQSGGAGGGGGGASGVAGATGGPCSTNFSGGAGGGGSGYIGGVTGGATSSAVHAGNGQVTITW
jgi:hypothetical protein